MSARVLGGAPAGDAAGEHPDSGAPKIPTGKGKVESLREQQQFYQSNRFGTPDFHHSFQDHNRPGTFNMGHMANALPPQPSYGDPTQFNANNPYFTPQYQYPVYMPPQQPVGGYWPSQMHQMHPEPSRFYQNSVPPTYGYYPQHANNSGLPPIKPVTTNNMPGEASVQSPGSAVDPSMSYWGSVATNSPLQSAAVRGPPPKPRQNSTSIWIGNLPVHTDLMDLVRHVSKLASNLDSLFLIRKSNCAFANYKTDQECEHAQVKIHDSKFNNARLVSRIRKSGDKKGSLAAQGGSASATKSSPAQDIQSQVSSPESQPPATPVVASSTAATQPDSKNGGASLETQSGAHSAPLDEPAPKERDRFFIMKSLTTQDLERSVKNGVWATQSHNEQTLNDAFQSADSVYLIFSANKSSEYFGYARMKSRLDDDPAAAIKFSSETQPADDEGMPRMILTEATEHVSQGRITDDSSRGTIFWEAIRENDESDGGSDDAQGDKATAKMEEEKQIWGKPFKVEWLCTSRLSFHRTRALKNPWNTNREVKIARDGTELEPNCARSLISLFNRFSPWPSRPGTHRPGVGVPFAPRGPMVDPTGIYPPSYQDMSRNLTGR